MFVAARFIIDVPRKEQFDRILHIWWLVDKNSVGFENTERFNRKKGIVLDSQKQFSRVEMASKNTKNFGRG